MLPVPPTSMKLTTFARHAGLLCADALEIGILLNKSRSVPRLSGGGQLILDLIGVFLLVPAAFLNWYTSGPSDYQPTPAEIEGNQWPLEALWVGFACL